MKLLGWIAIVFVCAQSWPAIGQAWPSRPPRIIVAFPPGGGLDFIARLLSKKLTEQLNTTFVVENRSSGGIVGVEVAARAAPDGYTLLAVGPEFAINSILRSKLEYEPFRDFSYITQLTSGQYLLVSHPGVPVSSVKQLIALARSKPGLLNYGSSGSGGLNHLAGVLLQSQANIKWVHVPYKGTGPNLIGLMGGEIDFSFGSITALLGLAEAGKVRPIAVTGPARSTALPHIPTISESGLPGYIVTGWYGLLAPTGTPPEIIRRLNTETAKAMNSTDVRDQLAKAGTEPKVNSSEEFSAFMQSEIGKWTKVIRESNVRID